ncbi:polysaccharide deacetylase family protein [Sphingomonas sp. XXL09]|uniref:polysaccharide deacetylase family protein n=1 Tax=Sphingomonas sp. XXL09 TaxID=3457787 RepID=UPI00406BAF78
MPPFRPSPPSPDAIVDWPADFGRRYTVFVDVEEEFDWTAPLSRDHRAVTAIGALPEACRRFRDCGIGLAFMVDYPVTEDPAACDILCKVLEEPRNTLGAQLHAWVNPPYFPASPGDSYAGNLPIANEAAKLDALTGRLEQAFGRRPLVYRAGRYGLGPATIELLAERGYRIDSSMRARYDYTADLGPDFSQIGNAAFRTGSLLELPLTTVFTGAWRRHGGSLFPLTGRLPPVRGVVARAGLLQRVALTPEDMPIEAALEAVEVAAERDDLRLLTFSFHSPSLCPGHTPYVRNSTDLAVFWRWWSRMFEQLDRFGYAPASLDEILHATDNI